MVFLISVMIITNLSFVLKILAVSGIRNLESNTIKAG